MQDKRLKDISVQLMGVIEKICKKKNIDVEETLSLYTNLTDEEKEVLKKDK